MRKVYPGRRYYRYYGGCEFVGEVENSSDRTRKNSVWSKVCERAASFGRSGNALALAEVLADGGLSIISGGTDSPRRVS